MYVSFSITTEIIDLRKGNDQGGGTLPKKVIKNTVLKMDKEKNMNSTQIQPLLFSIHSAR